MTDGAGIVKGIIGGCIAACTAEATPLFSRMHALSGWLLMTIVHYEKSPPQMSGESGLLHRPDRRLSGYRYFLMAFSKPGMAPVMVLSSTQ